MFINNLEKSENLRNVNFSGNSRYYRGMKMRCELQRIAKDLTLPSDWPMNCQIKLNEDKCRRNVGENYCGRKRY